MSSEVSPQFLYTALQTVILIGAVVVAARKIAGRSEPREISPQPLDVREVKRSEDRFAPKVHEHPEYLTRGEWREACIRQHAEESARLNRIEGKLDAVPMVVSDSFKDLETKAEARASKLHERIGPIAEKTTSIRDALDRHLDDHRAGKA